ncbi:S8 family serine peptidase [Patulibacter minatonensis]|uniref:S8 family serine peptidase n=1 Tax=Patulibacter minatonensis TaxID=298163 RepID=UPI00047BC09B|nr:S8 family serine peptidase [Patulibacter minatonensis]
MSTRRVTTTAVATALTALALGASAAHAAAPTDPQAAGQQPLSIMKVPQALDVAGRPLQDVPVLVADTGLDLDHPDIASRLYALPAPVPAPDADGVGNLGNVSAGAAGWDLIGTDAPSALKPDADPSDPAGGSGHGTAVAGVLGAAWNNGQGGAGVAPNARFVALRTCWDGDQCYQSVQAPAIDWAADRGARVASFSWLSGPLEDGLRDAIKKHPQTLFVTIPSGNGGAYDADPEDPEPCNLDSPNVLCVSTSAPDDGLDCGAYGPGSVDVAVPTQNSITTTNGGGFGPTGCATSYAAPTAAGVATILFGIDPTASAADVKAAIVDSARKVPAWQGKSVSGGVVDAQAAVLLFQQRRGIAPGTGGGGGTGTTTKDTTKPVLTAKRRGRVTRTVVPLSIRVSETARIRMTIEKRFVGRKSFGKCRPENASNRRKPSCVTWNAQRVQTVPFQSPATGVAPKGARSFDLRLVDGTKKALPRGLYRVSVQATDNAGNASVVRRVTFRKTR